VLFPARPRTPCNTHLLAQETHARWIKRRQLPANLEGGESEVPGSTCAKAWLSAHGVLVCRPCHNAIHNAESNMVLAEEFNTLDRLLSHPKIFAFAKYNSRRPVKEKCVASRRK